MKSALKWHPDEKWSEHISTVVYGPSVTPKEDLDGLRSAKILHGSILHIPGDIVTENSNKNLSHQEFLRIMWESMRNIEINEQSSHHREEKFLSIKNCETLHMFLFEQR